MKIQLNDGTTVMVRFSYSPLRPVLDTKKKRFASGEEDFYISGWEAVGETEGLVNYRGIPKADWPGVQTTCSIFVREGDKKTVLGEGRAVCDSRDHFRKEVGRKLSLEKASKIAASNLFPDQGLRKDFRRRVFDIYMHRP